jgi:hypothetical protein
VAPVVPEVVVVRPGSTPTRSSQLVVSLPTSQGVLSRGLLAAKQQPGNIERTLQV